MLNLIYIYIPDLRGFEDTAFTFSSKYKVAMDGARIVISNGDNRFIENFYDDKTEISAIVGNNGAGKSSLLKRIYSFLQPNTLLAGLDNKEYSCIAVFEDIQKESSSLIVISTGEKNKYYRTDLSGRLNEDVIIDLSKNAVHVDSLNNLCNDRLIEVRNLNLETILNLKTTYITQVLDKEMYNIAIPNTSNLSTGGLIKTDIKINSKKGSEVVQYFHRVFLEQIDFIYKYCYGENRIELPFRANDYIKICFDYNLTDALIGLLSQDEYNRLENDPVKFRLFIQDTVSEFKRAFKIDTSQPHSVFAEALLSSYLTDLNGINSTYPNTVFHTDHDNIYGNEDGLFEFIRHCLNKCLNSFDFDSVDEFEDSDNPDSIELFSTFLTYLDLEMNHQFGNGKNNIIYLESVGISERYKEFLKLLVDDYNIKDVLWSRNSNNGNCILVPLMKEDNKNRSEVLNCNIKEFYNAYKKTAHTLMYLNFEWGLSSGEEAMLDLYCKFHKIHKSLEEDRNNKIAIKNLILLIDEADMLFHPQWQKDYVNETIKVIKQIFSSIDGVQILLASHSPIMLSDIPKQNVIYLKKESKDSNTKIVPRENRYDTFGANIFRLFQDTFFLDESGIGSFAEAKMVELLERIHKINKNTSETELEQIKKYISIIGDPYLKRNFELEYYHFLEKSKPKDYRNEWRNYLEKQIELLNDMENNDDQNKQMV